MSGFETALAPYDAGLLVQSDVTHKLLRDDTALDVMYCLYNAKDPGDAFQRKVYSELIGGTVMTK